jgi:hypothetical protein
MLEKNPSHSATHRNRKARRFTKLLKTFIKHAMRVREGTDLHAANAADTVPRRCDDEHANEVEASYENSLDDFRV